MPRWKAGTGRSPAITAQQRIPAVKLATRQQFEVPDRKDKTGSRTFTGVPAGGRRRTTFDLRTYMTSWMDPAQSPAHGPLFQAGLGGAPQCFRRQRREAARAVRLLVFAGAARADTRAGSNVFRERSDS